MADTRAELWAELNATDETFIREKYARGGYPPAREKLVGEWLREVDSRRRDEAMQAAASRTAKWTMVSALAGLATIVLAALSMFR